jgi:hypothetical protein
MPQEMLNGYGRGQTPFQQRGELLICKCKTLTSNLNAESNLGTTELSAGA